MVKLFNKINLSAVLALLSLNVMNSTLIADDCCYYPTCNRLYIGVFGGETYSNRAKIRQTGVAFFTEALGGPLAIDARGHSKKKSSGFGGVQIGYEWSQSQACCCSNWSFAPAAELEAFFYRHNHKAHLINPTIRLSEHDFRDSFRTDVGVYLLNGVLSINNCCFRSLSPYIGGGIGAANLRLRKAKSFQVEPPELGVNHFNSKREDTDWAFAAQAKAGLRYNFCERFHIFAEYRLVFVDTNKFNLGSTVYPNHAPTTTWNVDVKRQWFNSWAIGIQFDL